MFVLLLLLTYCELDSFLIDEVEEEVDEIVVDVELDGIALDGERNSEEIE